MSKTRMMLTLVVGLALGAGADVVTNVWINPAGGDWSDPANWQGGAVAFSETVADFRQLASGSTVTISNNIYVSGLLFAGGADDVWTISPDPSVSYSRLRTRTMLGYMPINIEGGTLQLDVVTIFEGNHIVRKEGSGTLLTMHDFPAEPILADNQVIVADGALRPNGVADLWQANIHVTGTGVLDVPDSHPALWLGSYSSDNGSTFDLNGRRLLFGALRDDVLSESIVGTGQVVAVAGNALSITNARPGVEYVAREGVLRFGEMSLVGHWKFDDPANPGKDSGLAGNDLAVSNSVTVVDDEVRGKVAQFGANSSLFGMGPDRSIKYMPIGNSSYTMAAWVKKGSAPQESALFYWGDLPVVAFHGLLCKFTNAAGKIYVGHDGYGCQGAAITDIADWHHVAFTYDGSTKRITIYVDGSQNGTMICGSVNAAVAKNFAIGSPWSQYAAYPNGLRMDDAYFFNRCLSVDEVAAVKEGTFNADAVTLPAGVVLSTTFNSEIQLAGDQTIAEIGGDAMLGGVNMPLGGTLTVTGDVEKVISVYSAGIAGDVSLVKDGADTTLQLAGPLSYTGSTRVKAGTLAVNSVVVDKPFAAYDFESPNLGVDSSGNGRMLTVNGPTRVWDEERNGWVARFTAANKQDINGSVGSATELVGNSDYTFSVWAKPSASCPSQASFLSFGDYNSLGFQQLQFRFHNFSARTLALAHWGGTLDFTGIPSTAASPVGEWHHYVAVHEGTAFRVYVDGVQTWSTTNAQTLYFQKTHQLYIGSCFGAIANNAQRYFDGDMDDVRVYDHALDAAEVRGLYEGASPSLEVPAPVLHYAFEDASDPGKDSSGSGCDLTATGTLTCEDSPLGGKALKFDESAVSYLSASPLPSAIPAAGEPMTVTFWVQSSLKEAWNGTTYPTFVSWGDSGAGTINFMSAYRYDIPWRPRLYMMKSGGNAIDIGGNKDFLMSMYASDELRWHHFAIVYDPAGGVRTYIDGQQVSDLSSGSAFTNVRTASGTFYLGVKPTNLTHRFRGSLDEVKVYAAALSKAQVRAALRGEQGQGTRILPAGTDMTVDSGAKLSIGAGEQTVLSLAGGGTVSIATNACLTASDFSDFTGSIVGAGTLGVADGATLNFGDGSVPVLVSEGTVALGANVTVTSSFMGGTRALIRAAAFTGVENLSSWNVVLSRSGLSEFRLSADGKTLELRAVQRGFSMSIR